MRPSPRLLPLLALPLLACPAYEGPIDVILVDMDDSADLGWAEAGSSTFEPCTNGTTNPEAMAGCGPYGVGRPGDYIVRVTWQGVTVDKAVTLEKDNSYLANTEVEFTAAEFVEG
ncbi:hypothetical protein L6R53_11530 [Myxococcota bacterium]|nr:hypothetical protein [Myxococcota bacterium]